MRKVQETDRRQWMRVAAECVGVSLRKTTRVVTQLFDEALRPSGLRATQFTVLIAVALADPPTMTRIARALAMDPTTLTRNLGPLERTGLVKSVGGKDRRTRFVTLTPQGRNRLAAAWPLWEQAHTGLMRRVGSTRWQDLLGSLSAVKVLAGAS